MFLKREQGLREELLPALSGPSLPQGKSQPPQEVNPGPCRTDPRLLSLPGMLPPEGWLERKGDTPLARPVLGPPGRQWGGSLRR